MVSATDVWTDCWRGLGPKGGVLSRGAHEWSGTEHQWSGLPFVSLVKDKTSFRTTRYGQDLGFVPQVNSQVWTPVGTTLS